MLQVQYFKGTEDEKNVDEAGRRAFDLVSQQQTLFYDDAYNNFLLGELIYDLEASPLSNAIRRDIFIETFNALFSNFQVAGSFESYIEVFKRIFGDDVGITFTVPGPGRLQILIEANGLQISNLVTRYLVGDEYVFDYLVDREGDRISVQTVKGIESQYELELMLNEMVPAGVFTEITLTTG